MRIKFNQDGTIQGEPQIMNAQSTAFFMAAAESAKRAERIGFDVIEPVGGEGQVVLPLRLTRRGIETQAPQHLQVGTAVLPEQLAASSAGHQHLTRAVDADEVGQPAAPGQVQLGDQSALGAQAHAVGGVLDVAAGDHTSVIDSSRSADRVARVGRIGMTHRLDRGVLQLLPRRRTHPADPLR